VSKFKKSLVWLRRDLRLYDNAALYHALNESNSVHCAFVFDTNILDKLKNKTDQRVEFIWESLFQIKSQLNKFGSDLIVEHGDPRIIIPKLIEAYQCDAMYINKDYEAYANKRDAEIIRKLKIKGFQYKDQVLYEKDEILTQSGTPYTVFTPYKNNYIKRFFFEGITQFDCEALSKNYAKIDPVAMLSLNDLGFKVSNLKDLAIPAGEAGGKLLIEDFKKRIHDYKLKRDFPGTKGVSYLSVHNRFGTVSIRQLAKIALDQPSEGSSVWLSELIWRDFYFQILFNFPHINEGQAFKSQFNNLKFENNPEYFMAWKEGRTGYPIIDAAMRQLNKTGFMHNRLRMVAASFLVKDLLIDWRWGEDYFAEKLIDFDFSANNGGWQWAASTGCDAQPWFRIFNPILQSKKFDAEGQFIKKYVPELNALSANEIHEPWENRKTNTTSSKINLGVDYPMPIVNHSEQRLKALAVYSAKK
jgi:deoxyribodipyrimidine photo-lyase